MWDAYIKKVILKKGVILLRIYVADNEDTLLKISDKYQVGLDLLISINPHIDCFDRSIAGQRINLPYSSWAPIENRVVAHFCPPGAGGGAALWRLCEQW